MADIHEVLSLLKGVEQHGDYWMALCPAHDDKTPSLKVEVGHEGKVLLYCYAGCTPKGPGGPRKVCNALGKPVAWLWPDWGLDKREKKIAKLGRLVAAYDYRDEEGVLLYQSCRYEKDDGSKTFVQRRPNDEGGWIYSVKDVRRVPYRLPELLQSHKSEPVWIPEGEKHVEALRDMGFTATCNVGGAGKWLKAYAPFLAGRDVIILPDNDEAGRKHAAKVFECLRDAAKSVRQVTLPNLPEKGDVIDWLAAGGTADGLRALVEQATDVPEPAPEAEITFPADDEILERLGLSVFGEDEDGRIKVFSEHAKKSMWLRDVDKLSRAKLIQLCGPRVREAVYVGRDETPDGMYRVADVREAIASKASDRRIGELSELGAGVWVAQHEDHVGDCVVLVNSGQASVLNQRPGLQTHARPWYGAHVLDLGNAEWWFDHDHLAGLIDAYTPDWARQVVEELQAIYARWYFGPGMDELMPALLSGLTLATWVQTVWKWRPQVFVLGKSNTGKTTLFEFLAGANQQSHGLFDQLVVSSSDTTAPGVRQTLGNSAKVVILDEVENSRHRAEIYAMLRNSGRGGKALRGRPTQKSAATGIRNIAWVAATESGLKKEVDRNRFIMVNLLPPPSARMGLLKLPGEKATMELGQKTLAVAVKTVLAARALAEQLVDRRPRGFHHRVVESYAVPAAAYAAATGMDEAGAFGLLEAFLGTTDPSEIEPDEERVFDAILDFQVHLRSGTQSTIGKLIRDTIRSYESKYQSDEEEEAALDRYGLAVFRKSLHPDETWIGGEEFCLFLNCAAVETHVLSRIDEWKGIRLREILLRREKATWCRKRMPSGRRPRGVLIPIAQEFSDE